MNNTIRYSSRKESPKYTQASNPSSDSDRALPVKVIVAGIPGVGKTTVLHELESIGREKKIPVRVINFGDIMNEIFKKKGQDLHRDHMRRQDITLQTRIQQQAARKISRIKGGTSLVVDTHMFVKTVDGLWPGTPKRVLDALNPDLIVLIEAEPEQVAKRRTIDKGRVREGNELDNVRSDLEWSRYMASANAVIAGIPIQIVNNNEGQQRQAAEDLLRIIQKMN